MTLDQPAMFDLLEILKAGVMPLVLVFAVGVSADGNQKVLGMNVGDSEDGAFWTAFLLTLKAWQLSGMQSVTSYAHTAFLQAHWRQI